jgi:hypothetical protein
MTFLLMMVCLPGCKVQTDEKWVVRDSGDKVVKAEKESPSTDVALLKLALGSKIEVINKKFQVMFPEHAYKDGSIRSDFSGLAYLTINERKQYELEFSNGIFVSLHERG